MRGADADAAAGACPSRPRKRSGAAGTSHHQSRYALHAPISTISAIAAPGWWRPAGVLKLSNLLAHPRQRRAGNLALGRQAGAGQRICRDQVLVYLLGSRYCDTDRLATEAWALFGKIEPGWPRVQAILDYTHNRIQFGYDHARADRTASEGHQGAQRRLPRLRPSGDHPVPLHEYSGALLHRLSGRYRRAGRSGADGFQRLVRSLSGRRAGTRWMRATTSPASAAS